MRLGGRAGSNKLSYRTPVIIAIARIRWEPVLCKENFTEDLVAELQTKLGTHYAGRGGIVDGIYGAITTEAVDEYQRVNTLARGGLTFELLEKLRIDWRRR